MWELFALSAAFLFGLLSIVTREIMKESGSISYTWAFNALSAAFFLFFIWDFSVLLATFPWVIAIVAGILWSAVGVIGAEAYKYTEVSLIAPVSKIGLPLVFLLSVAVLGETVTISKAAGILLVFAGAVVLTWEKGFFGKMSQKGVRLTILAAALFSIVAILDKVAVGYFTPAMYGFLMFLFPSLMLAPLAARNPHGIRRLMKKKLLVAVSVVLAAAGYFLQLTAFTLTEVSNAIPVIELSILVSVTGGCFFHREKEFGKRLAGAIIMLAGSVLILRPF